MSVPFRSMEGIAGTGRLATADTGLVLLVA